MDDSPVSKSEIVIERTFDVPIEFVWKMWTEPEHFKNWYGPGGFTMPIVEMDVRVGGKHLFCMQSPDGSMKMCTAGEYTAVVPNKRLVYTDSMADEDGNVLAAVAHGVDDESPPMTTVVTVELEDLDGRTKMTVTHAGVPKNQAGATEGWNQAFTKMADYMESALSNE